MMIDDVLYGGFEISEPVLLELIESGPVQRMKKVSQTGTPPEWELYPGFSRYDHLVGVMVLLRDKGASLEEQTAGLLHDVSHTAFSHVMDWVTGTIKEQKSFQDANHEKYVRSTSIPKILARHGCSLEGVLDLRSFSLLEQPQPALCADRIDYALRELWHIGRKKEALDCASALLVHDNRFVFESHYSAIRFWKQYTERNDNHWAGIEHKIRYHLLADAVKAAMNDKLISINDLYKTDAHVVGLLRSSQNIVVKKSLHLLDKGFKFVVDEKNPDYVVQAKFRYIDPAFIDDGSVHKLSEVMPEYSSWLQAAREKHVTGTPVRIVS
jgi:hypothetical protein